MPAMLQESRTYEDLADALASAQADIEGWEAHYEKTATLLRATNALGFERAMKIRKLQGELADTKRRLREVIRENTNLAEAADHASAIQ